LTRGCLPSNQSSRPAIARGWFFGPPATMFFDECVGVACPEGERQCLSVVECDVRGPCSRSFSARVIPNVRADRSAQDAVCFQLADAKGEAVSGVARWGVKSLPSCRLFA